MEYFLDEMDLEIKALARQVAEEKGLPVRAELDEKEEFPSEIMKALADSDLLGIYIPEEYGGMGKGVFGLSLVTEELSRVCGGIAVSYAANALGSEPIILHGSEEQKKKYLPPIASGEHLVAFGLTESNAGSDAGGIETTARRDGDYYVLNGTKQWITNGGEAQTYTIIATTNKKRGMRGISCFIVEKDTPGFTFGKKEKKMGIRCSATRELVFTDCRIPAENLIGKEGHGFRIAMDTFNASRPGIGAQAVGIAQGAMEYATDFARGRVQFGKPVASFQGVHFMLADMATSIEAARALVYGAARTGDKVQLSKYKKIRGESLSAEEISMMNSYEKYSAMAKLFASDVAMKVTTDAVQICGGTGYMREYPLEKMMRDAKITQIYEGTNQIQRSVIGLKLIQESAKRR